MIAALLIAAGLPEIAATAPPGAAKLLVPGTRGYDVSVASSSRAPLVDSNGWRFRREPSKTFAYENVPDARLALAAAETHVFGGKAVIVGTNPAKLAPVLAFLQSIEGPRYPAVADFAVVDDGSTQTGEVLNLLTRRNLLWAPIAAFDKRYPLVVEIGSPRFPRKAAANPSDFASLVRQALTDEKRSLRVYGSETIVGYLTAEGGRARLHLLNYSTDPVDGFRVRVLGPWKLAALRAYGQTGLAAEDVESARGGLEFGLPRLGLYAVADLEKQ
ncbi:MAG: hypothetical protein SFV18_13555 [Bryobacteraceae bacterium]|nr:hypothetical protein [Bryobacteraceae bacterium]